jgi:phenylpropionate dioxygenase-like ring-hydroxylating dioxygenase large terminal subunit
MPMISNQWYVVLESSEVRAGRPVGVTRMGERLVFWRDTQGHVVCQRDLCAHRGVALSAGKVVGDFIQCPFHGLEYDPSGRCQLIPANGRTAPVPEQFRVHTYLTHEAHGLVYIWWGDGQPEPAVPPFFEDIDDSFSYSTVRDPWFTHYSRVIENQLDAAHLPFVHYNTIGRGNRTVVNGPLVKWIHPNLMFVYTWNDTDHGQRPLKPEEVPDPPSPFHLEFLFPNLWENHISPNVRILAAFVPVDEEHTLLYLRFYQNFVRVPILRNLFTRLAMPFNVYVAHQDRRVVQTQRPKRSFLKIGEKLFQADGPILAYRQGREELLARAGRAEGDAVTGIVQR